MVNFGEPSRRDHESALSITSGSSSLSDADDCVNDRQPQTTDRDERRAHKKKKRRRARDGGITELNGGGSEGRSESRKRKHSLSKAARDPRDEPEGRKKKKSKSGATETRSPSPVIDFDGLSRPSLFPILTSPGLRLLTNYF